ncbi:spermidine/putrescine ABC transporter ATP-binding protein [Mameliella alba]|uniref:ABC transporter ATP-binding protein n=1 Tax=Mameliella alba TaxID=561184 RepID=UPI000B52CD44|nr:ABC transporter ATP-binding protein [Mameliella alba]OWV39788.1 spermidine/putrescine ABC transporter ATP-binding protein [Mameliella alba]OWV55674.1 spermidine/putrescine ABC transporter ATP-binding protein [Mameliella alba]
MAESVFAPWNDPEAKPLIQFKGVTKRFGDFTAIDDLTQNIYEREFFALLGPSGCGKTTLMRMLAGFEEPTEGQILLNGVDIGHVPPNKRAVNMMFQSYALFPHLSVYDNIAFGLRREKKPKDEIHARVKEMLRLTRLDRFAQRKPHQISGGQRQRVALARSLAKAPKLLLLDEPLGALDKKLREETQFELMDIQEKTGTTFIIVTHDQEEAMTVASRVAVMDEGRIVQVATPDVIYEAPNSVYVADFIGDVNLIRGTARARPTDTPPETVAKPEPEPKPAPAPKETASAPAPERAAPQPNTLGRALHDKLLSPIFGKWLEDEPRRLPPPTAPEAPRAAAPETPAPSPQPQDIPPGGLEIDWSEGQAAIIAANGDPALDGEKVVLALRPEKLGIAKTRPEAPNTLKGKVIDIAYLGNISTYHVEIEGGVMVKAQAANTRRIARRDITWEDEVWLSFTATAGVILKDE